MKRSIFWMVISIVWVFAGSLYLFYDIAHGKWTWAGLWLASVLLNTAMFILHASEAKRINEEGE